jgi:hypothetical protein
VCDDLRAFVARERQAGRLSPDGARADAARLAAPAARPPDRRTAVLLLAAPLLHPLLAGVPRSCSGAGSRSDPEIAPRPDPEHAKRLADLEDHDVTNQFSAMGTLKPVGSAARP